MKTLELAIPKTRKVITVCNNKCEAGQTMSRKGNCFDNACAKNFFSLLRTELLYLQEFTSVEHFILERTEYIDWYNKRIKLKLDGLSPVDYRHKAA